MGMIDLFRKVAFAQALLGLITYAVAEQDAAMVLAAGTLGMLSWYVVEGPGGRPLPRWIINVGVLGATAWLFYSQLPGDGRPPLIVTLGQFIMCMILFKLYERKNNRDWAQLMVLSLMQMICALIQSSEVLFGVLVVLYLILTLFAVLLFQLKMGHEEVVRINELQTPKGHRPAVPKPVVTRGYRRHFNILSLTSGLGCVFIAIFFFLLLPRGSGMGMLGDWQMHGQVKSSGFTDKLVHDPEGGRIHTSRLPVMNLSLTDLNGKELGPGSYDAILIRGIAQDKYDPSNRSWTRSPLPSGLDRQITPAKPEDAPKPPIYPLVKVPPNLTGGVVTQTYTLRAATKGIMFSIYPPVEVGSTDIKTIQFNPYDHVLESQQAGGGGVQYTVKSLAPDSPTDLRGAYDARWKPMDPAKWALYARGHVLPPGHVDAVKLNTVAESIMALQRPVIERDPKAQSTPNDHKIAQAVVDWLQTNCTYTLDLPRTKGAEPITAFLLDNRSGHCEYFASGMCSIVREMGMRARVVTGFRASEYNSLGNYYIIRDMHAHAWVEVWQDGVGWKAFDPSPAAAVASLHKPPGGWILGPLRDLYEWVEFKWLDKVINYDTTQRQTVVATLDHNFSAVAERLKKLKERINAYIDAFREQWKFGVWGYLILFAILSILVAAALGLVAFFIRRRRIIRQLQLAGVSRRVQRRLARHLEFYLQMLRLLEKAGFTKPVWQTPAAFAAQLQLQNAVRFAPVVPLTDLFYEIRFGARPLDTDRAQKIHGHIESLRGTV